MDFRKLAVMVALLALGAASVVDAAAKKVKVPKPPPPPLTCPPYRDNNGCNTGPCSKGGLKGKFAIPSNCPLLVGYGTQAFKLSGELPDDTVVNANIRAYNRKTAERCCLKCKDSAKCTFWQWLNMGSYGGLCFVYRGGIGPECTENVLVFTKVGGKCKATINDDPHLVGAHGTRYDFAGEPDKSFCLLSDRNIHINMKLTGYLDNRTESATVLRNGKAVRTWIKEVGIMWYANGEGHSLRLAARGGKETARGNGFLGAAVLDGFDLPSMQVTDALNLDGNLVMKFEEVEKRGPYEVEYYTVKIADLLDMDIRVRVANPLLQRPDDAEIHFSLGINWVKNTPSIHGVLGQTYREGRENRAIEFSKLAALLHHPLAADSDMGEGFLDGRPADYVTSSVTDTDCKFSQYQGWARSDAKIE